MLLEPSVIVFYADDLSISKAFYEKLFGIIPDKDSPDFCSFKLSSGIIFALKSSQNVTPPVDSRNGNGELAFTVDNDKKVDELFSRWQNLGINIILPAQKIAFGYSFVAHDPDSNRLRVLSLGVN